MKRMNRSSSIYRAFGSLACVHGARPNPTFSQRFHFIALIRLEMDGHYHHNRALRGCRYYVRSWRRNDSRYSLGPRRRFAGSAGP